MLIVYDKATGDVYDNTGTNSLLPEGPTLEESIYVNIDARGISRDSLSLLRLHDEDDAVLVAQALANRHRVDNAGRLVIVGPYPVETLTADPLTAAPAAEVLITYRNTHDDAPAAITFTANGAQAGPVALDGGVAELVVTMPAQGDVTVTIDRDDVAPVTVRGV